MYERGRVFNLQKTYILQTSVGLMCLCCIAMVCANLFWTEWGQCGLTPAPHSAEWRSAQEVVIRY